METRMRYTSAEQYLEMSRGSNFRDPGLDLFYVQLLDGSPWNPPYAGVITPQNSNSIAARHRGDLGKAVM
jgi:hypothetical protein